MKVYVNIISPRGSVKKFPVGEKPIKIGRKPGIQVQIADDLCSGEHAMLFTENDHLYVSDLDSKNGVILNGVRIVKQRVYLGDLLLLGNTRIEIDRYDNPTDVIKALTPDDPSRTDGNITLELEKSPASREYKEVNEAQKQFVRQSKLYEGVSETVRVNKKNDIGERLKDWMALTLDVILSLFVLALIHTLFNKASPETDPLFYLLAGSAAGFAFFKWNRARPQGSLGEKILGVD